MKSSAEEEGKTDNELVQLLASCPQNEVLVQGPELFEVVFEFVARKAGAMQGPVNETSLLAEKNIILSKRNTLRRLVQNGPKQVEYQAKALKSLVDLSSRNQHPKGFLERMFELLYKDDIIFEDAFALWSDSASASDKLLCRNFLLYLSEAEAESGDDA